MLEHTSNWFRPFSKNRSGVRGQVADCPLHRFIHSTGSISAAEARGGWAEALSSGEQNSCFYSSKHCS